MNHDRELQDAVITEVLAEAAEETAFRRRLWKAARDANQQAEAYEEQPFYIDSRSNIRPRFAAGEAVNLSDLAWNEYLARLKHPSTNQQEEETKKEEPPVEGGQAEKVPVKKKTPAARKRVVKKGPPRKRAGVKESVLERQNRVDREARVRVEEEKEAALEEARKIGVQIGLSEPSGCGDKRGTITGYRRHRAVGESTCRSCKDARAAYQRDLKRRKKEKEGGVGG